MRAPERLQGSVLETGKQILAFCMGLLVAELEETLLDFEEPVYSDICEQYSDVYNRILKLDLGKKYRQP